MITGVAFCPHPPVLVPDVGLGASPELDELRDHAEAAIHAVAQRCEHLVLFGAGTTSRVYSPLARGTFAGFGVPLEVSLGSPACGGDVELPLSLTVGAWLVSTTVGPRSNARGVGVGPDYAASTAAAEALRIAETEDIGLVVMGDGSARRTTAAPGYVDERAVEFDDQVTRALAAGDADALADLDLVLAAELLAAGAPAWRAAGRLLAGAAYDATVLIETAPFGVNYVVATWVPTAVST